MKQIQILVTDIDDEVCIHDEESLKRLDTTLDEADKMFAGVGYWLIVTLKNCDYGMKQETVREAGGDETLLPQKRFAAAAAKVERRPCGGGEPTLYDPTEKWFRALDPPEIAEALDVEILKRWYPTASRAAKDKTANFIKASRSKQTKSEAAQK